MALLPQPWDALLLLALAAAFLVATHWTLRRLRPDRARRWLGHPLFTLGVAPAALLLALVTGPTLVFVGAVSTAWLLHGLAWIAAGHAPLARRRPALAALASVGATGLVVVGLIVVASRYERTPGVVSYAFLGALLAFGVGAACVALAWAPRARRLAPRIAAHAALFFPLGFAYVGWSADALVAVDGETMGVAAGGVVVAGVGSLLWMAWRAGGRGVLARWLEPEARLPLVAATACAVALLAVFTLGSEGGFRLHVALQRSAQTMGLYAGMLGAPLAGALRGAWGARRARQGEGDCGADDDGAPLPPA